MHQLNSSDLLPKPGGKSCSLDHLHVEEALTCNHKDFVSTRVVSRGGGAALFTFLLPDGGVLTVGQWTGRAVTQPRDVVFIPAETLVLGPDNKEKIGEIKAAATRFSIVLIKMFLMMTFYHRSELINVPQQELLI